jgi:hypothetical protein
MWMVIEVVGQTSVVAERAGVGLVPQHR